MKKTKYEYGNYWYDGIEYKIPRKSELNEYYKVWSKKLTKKEKRAVLKYKICSLFKNRKQRKQDQKMENDFLSDALEKASIYGNLVVNRSIRKGELEEIEKIYRKKEISTNEVTFTKNDFCSTYTKPFIYRYNHKANLIILIPIGSKAAFLDGRKGIFSFEKEILIQKNSKFSFIKEEKILQRKVYVVKLSNT